MNEIDYWYKKYLQEKQKNSWSKDDERLRNTTIVFLKDFADKGYENAIECIDWLKTLGEK